MRFLLRVDDIGQLPVQSERDIGLAYFKAWWEAGGWSGLPVYLGAVAGCIGADELTWLSRNILPPAELAVHGWDHAPDRELTHAELVKSKNHLEETGLRVRALIPPYNRISDETVAEWGRIVGPEACVFGGFDGDNHNHGDSPRFLEGVLHLPADRCLYCHSYRLAPEVARLAEVPGVRVVTLHHRWDEKFLAGVGRLREAIAPRLTTVDEVMVGLGPRSPDGNG